MCSSFLCWKPRAILAFLKEGHSSLSKHSKTSAWGSSQGMFPCGGSWKITCIPWNRRTATGFLWALRGSRAAQNTTTLSQSRYCPARAVGTRWGRNLCPLQTTLGRDRPSDVSPSSCQPALPAHRGAVAGRSSLRCEMGDTVTPPVFKAQRVWLAEESEVSAALHRAECHGAALQPPCPARSLGLHLLRASPGMMQQHLPPPRGTRQEHPGAAAPWAAWPCQRPPDGTSAAGNRAGCKNLCLQECSSPWLTASAAWCPGEGLGSCHTCSDDALTQHWPLLMAFCKSNSLK